MCLIGCLAIEFSLKEILSRAGLSIKDLKEIGHDIIKLLNKLHDVSPETRKDIEEFTMNTLREHNLHSRAPSFSYICSNYLKSFSVAERYLDGNLIHTDDSSLVAILVKYFELNLPEDSELNPEESYSKDESFIDLFKEYRDE